MKHFTFFPPTLRTNCLNYLYVSPEQVLHSPSLSVSTPKPRKSIHMTLRIKINENVNKINGQRNIIVIAWGYFQKKQKERKSSFSFKVI